MDLRTALAQLNRDAGYCLWVGAGVSIHLARAGGQKVPSWAELTADLECEAKLTPPGDLSYPDRLDVVLRELGRERFQRELRARLHNATCSAVVAAGRLHMTNEDDPIPPAARDLLRLGGRANPIVNFNIETLTSVLLAGAAPYDLRAFTPPVPDAITSLRTSSGAYDRTTFTRAVYHPHGAVALKGVCVMTSSEYRAMKGTLALQLAVHAAFHTDLMIVGMSLDDEYLRAQLADFRQYIGRIFWFTAGTPDERAARWAYLNDITPINVGTWSDFWEAVRATFPMASEEKVALAWQSALARAAGDTQPDRLRQLFEETAPGAPIPEAFARLRVMCGVEEAPRGPYSGTDVFSKDGAEAMTAVMRYLMRKVWKMTPKPSS